MQVKRIEQFRDNMAQKPDWEDPAVRSPKAQAARYQASTDESKPQLQD